MKKQYSARRNLRNIIGILSFSILISANVSAQKIGITNTATFTPNYLLHIHDNVATTGTLLQMTNSNSGSTINDGFKINLSTGKIEFVNQENAAISFYTNNLERMFISSAGLVGIGTTSPSVKLTVAGGHGDTKLLLYSTGNGSDQPANLSLWASEPGVTYYGTGIGYNVNGHPFYGRIDATRGSSYIRFLPGETKFEFQNSSGTTINDVMVAKDNGNIGIGTASPSKKLDVSGDINFSGALYANGGAGTAGQLLLSAGGSTNTWLPLGSSGQLLVSTGATPGWQNVSTALNNTAWLTTKNTGLSDNSTNLLGTTDAIPIRFITGNSQRAMIDASGYVGINTTPSSSYQLYINTTAQQGLYSYNSSATGGSAYTNAGSYNGIQGFVWNGYAYHFGVFGSRYDDNTGPSAGVLGTVNYNNPTAWGALGFQDASLNEWAGYFTGKGYFSDNVGIGTTSPSYKLHVTGDIYANGGWFRVSGTNGICWESYGPGWYVQDGTWLRTYNNASIWANTGTIATNGSFSCGYGGTSGPSGGAIFSGSVGVGTSTPSYTLDLNTGTFAFGNGNVRTQSRDDAGLQGNAGAQSGFFETSAPSPVGDWPVGASSWWHMIDCRHSNNSNNYALQIAGSFFNQDLYYRKTNGSANTPWTKIGKAPVNYTYNSSADLCVNSTSWLNFPNCTSTLILTAGQKVKVSAQGGVMADSDCNGASNATYTNYDVRMAVNSADFPDGAWIRSSVNNWDGTGAFNSWTIAGTYDIPADGSYTFTLQARVYSGYNCMMGGNNTSSLQATMMIEVTTP
jgi:hypothetical protein